MRKNKLRNYLAVMIMLIILLVVSLCVIAFVHNKNVNNKDNNKTTLNETANPDSGNQNLNTPEPTGSSFLAINTSGTTIKDRFNLPEGFVRVNTTPNTFSYYMQNFPLKEYGATASYYDANTVNTNAGIYGIFDFEKINKWQDCADSVIRLWATYYYNNGQFDKISFNFSSNFKCDFNTWSSGKKVLVDNSHKKGAWVDDSNNDTSLESFKRYLNTVFQFANTESIQKQGTAVLGDNISIGDFYVLTAAQLGESLGHTLFIADMAINPATGEKIALIAEGTTPASDIYVVYADSYNYGAWFTLDSTGTLVITKKSTDSAGVAIKKSWTYDIQYLRRFAY